MAKRYECPADPLDLTHLEAALDACSARDKKVRAEAREWLVQFYRLLEVHLGDAQPKAGSGEVEERRVEAIRICLALYRLRSRQLDKGGGEILTDIEREAGQVNVEVRLRNFVASTSSAVFLADDPEKVLALILHGRPRKGAKRKNDYRDFMIAADVEERKRMGETLDAAYSAVRVALGKEKAARGPDAVRRIHA